MIYIIFIISSMTSLWTLAPSKQVDQILATVQSTPSQKEQLKSQKDFFTLLNQESTIPQEFQHPALQRFHPPSSIDELPIEINLDPTKLEPSLRNLTSHIASGNIGKIYPTNDPQIIVKESPLNPYDDDFPCIRIESLTDTDMKTLLLDSKQLIYRNKKYILSGGLLRLFSEMVDLPSLQKDPFSTKLKKVEWEKRLHQIWQNDTSLSEVHRNQLTQQLENPQHQHFFNEIFEVLEDENHLGFVSRNQVIFIRQLREVLANNRAASKLEQGYKITRVYVDIPRNKIYSFMVKLNPIPDPSPYLVPMVTHQACQQLHQKGIVYHDSNAHNIMLVSNTQNKISPVWIDLGNNFDCTQDPCTDIFIAADHPMRFLGTYSSSTNRELTFLNDSQIPIGQDPSQEQVWDILDDIFKSSTKKIQQIRTAEPSQRKELIKTCKQEINRFRIIFRDWNQAFDLESLGLDQTSMFYLVQEASLGHNTNVGFADSSTAKNICLAIIDLARIKKEGFPTVYSHHYRTEYILKEALSSYQKTCQETQVLKDRFQEPIQATLEDLHLLINQMIILSQDTNNHKAEKTLFQAFNQILQWSPQKNQLPIDRENLFRTYQIGMITLQSILKEKNGQLNYSDFVDLRTLVIQVLTQSIPQTIQLPWNTRLCQTINQRLSSLEISIQSLHPDYSSSVPSRQDTSFESFNTWEENNVVPYNPDVIPFQEAERSYMYRIRKTKAMNWSDLVQVQRYCQCKVNYLEEIILTVSNQMKAAIAYRTENNLRIPTQWSDNLSQWNHQSLDLKNQLEAIKLQIQKENSQENFHQVLVRLSRVEYQIYSQREELQLSCPIDVKCTLPSFKLKMDNTESLRHPNEASGSLISISEADQYPQRRPVLEAKVNPLEENSTFKIFLEQLHSSFRIDLDSFKTLIETPSSLLAIWMKACCLAHTQLKLPSNDKEHLSWQETCEELDKCLKSEISSLNPALIKDYSSTFSLISEETQGTNPSECTSRSLEIVLSAGILPEESPDESTLPHKPSSSSPTKVLPHGRKSLNSKSSYSEDQPPKESPKSPSKRTQRSQNNPFSTKNHSRNLVERLIYSTKYSA